MHPAMKRRIVAASGDSESPQATTLLPKIK